MNKQESPSPGDGSVRDEDVEHHLRVLIVDDNIDSAQSLALLVDLWGHLPLLAHDGPEAIEKAAEFQPEVALLDIGLPRMDGYEVAFRLRQQAGSRPLLLVAMTGYGHDEDRGHALETTFNHHLVKPLDLKQLESILANPDAYRDQAAPED